MLASHQPSATELDRRGACNTGMHEQRQLRAYANGHSRLGIQAKIAPRRQRLQAAQRSAARQAPLYLPEGGLPNSIPRGARAATTRGVAEAHLHTAAAADWRRAHSWAAASTWRRRSPPAPPCCAALPSAPACRLNGCDSPTLLGVQCLCPITHAGFHSACPLLSLAGQAPFC